MRTLLSLCLLAALLAAAPADPLEAGKVAYANGDHERAIEEFRKVIKASPNDAQAYLWLGRALGRKAEQSNPLRAAFLVGDIRKALERAVELAPSDHDARADLIEFYLEAPGSFGGGLDKARHHATVLAKMDPAEGHWAAARIAEKKKEYDLAERELRAAQDVDPKPGRWRELAQFFRRVGRWVDMEWAFKKANDRKSHYYLAAAYLQRSEKLEEAERLVQQFLKEPPPPPGDEPTLAQAHLLLGQIQARLGRRKEAQEELQTALLENPLLKAARQELERLK